MISLKSFEAPLIHDITDHMKNGLVGLIYLDVAKLSEIEEIYGRLMCEQIVLSVKSIVYGIKDEMPFLFGTKMAGDDLFLYAEFDHTDTAAAKHTLNETGLQFKARIERHLRDRFQIDRPVTLHVGSAVLLASLGRGLESILYSAMKEAIRQAKTRTNNEQNAELAAEFNELLVSRKVSSVYQPIVSLTDGSVFGYEALSRGPEGSPFRSPIALFDYAEREGYLYQLDHIAREKAIYGCSQTLGPGQRIFINLSAQIIHYSEFTSGYTQKLLERCGLTPNNVVFEITERSSVEDFQAVKKILQHYRQQGFQIAIDDAGAGYSSLQAIAELQPDYIKIDRSLIENIHIDRTKEYILETFVTFARKMQIKLIAEGIEEADELRKLMILGVHYAQGFFLGRPASNLQPIPHSLKEEIARQRQTQDSFTSMLTIGDLATPILTFLHKTRTSEVATYFKEHEDELGAVVLGPEEAPVGLIMRDKLFQQLAGQYGISLYWNKSISHLMDREALVVEHRLSPESVSQMAMARDKKRLYDFVTVVKDGRMVGAASIRSILESITQVRLEHARVASPLTGLPGNVLIQRQLRGRIAQGMPFAVLYMDLDFFKSFNDRYGFGRGDEVIQYTADVIQHAIAVCGNPHDFVGHIGGDDFIAITSTEKPDKLSEELLRRFRIGIGTYDDGAIDYVTDREGRQVAYEGLSLSIAVVECPGDRTFTPDDISRVAAQLKKRAKRTSGDAISISQIEN